MTLADLLAARAASLTERWVERMRPLAPHLDLTREQLVDSLPAFLDGLVRALRRLDLPSLSSDLPERSPVAAEHGRQRLRLGYTAGPVAREYPLLQELLLEQAHEAGVPVRAEESILLARCMGTAAAEALAPFASEQPQGDAARAARDSEERVRGLLESTAKGLWGLDAEGRCTFANPACVRMLGYGAAEELLGRNMHALTHHSRPDGTPYPEEACRIYEAFRNGREVETDDELMWRKDGSPLQVRLRASPIVRAGEVLGAVVAFDDVTEQKRAEAALRESEARLRRVVEASGTGTWELDLATGRIDADASHRALVGFSPDEPLAAASAIAVTDERDRERVAQAISAASAGEGEGRFLVEHRTVGSAHAPARWVEARGQVLFDAQGRPERLVGTGVDISERKAAERAREELMQALGQSEMRYRSISEAGIIGIVEWAGSGALTAANDAFLQMLGYTREDLAAGRLDFRALTPPEHQATTERAVRALKQTGVVLAFEKQYLRKDGSRVDVLISSATLDEAREHGIALVLDITARRRLEEALRASEERLRLALSAMGAGTFDLDVATGDMRFDARMRAITNLPPEGRVDVAVALGQVHPEDRPAVEAAFQSALTQGTPYFIEHRVVPRTEGERERWVEARGGTLFDAEGRPLRFIGTGVDVTAEKARAGFEQQLVGITSHDLRNPLQAILLTTQALLRSEGLDTRTTRAAVRVQSSAERALRLVRDLLDFTRARLGGGIPVQPRPLDLHALVRGVVEELEAAYPERELRHVCEGDGHGAWDGDRLAQVAENLLSNALKYSPEDSPVEVRTCGREDGVLLQVHNAGAPIAPELLPRIFEPLQRATPEVDRQGRSVGLGLYIVKHLVEAHGGSIEVRSSHEAGSTFTVRLPRAAQP